MKLVIKGGSYDGEVIELGSVYRYGDPKWVDPEAPDFDQQREAGATYQLRPRDVGTLRAVTVAAG